MSKVISNSRDRSLPVQPISTQKVQSGKKPTNLCAPRETSTSFPGLFPLKPWARGCPTSPPTLARKPCSFVSLSLLVFFLSFFLSFCVYLLFFFFVRLLLACVSPQVNSPCACIPCFAGLREIQHNFSVATLLAKFQSFLQKFSSNFLSSIGETCVDRNSLQLCQHLWLLINSNESDYGATELGHQEVGFGFGQIVLQKQVKTKQNCCYHLDNWLKYQLTNVVGSVSDWGSRWSC